jgi:hypothetical protein
VDGPYDHGATDGASTGISGQHRRQPALGFLGEPFVYRGNGGPEALRVKAASSTAASPNSSQTRLAAGVLPGVPTERLSKWDCLVMLDFLTSEAQPTAVFELTRTPILEPRLLEAETKAEAAWGITAMTSRLQTNTGPVAQFRYVQLELRA